MSGDFTVFDPPNASSTVPISINDRGEVAGSFNDTSDGGKRRGFLFWREGESKRIGKRFEVDNIKVLECGRHRYRRKDNICSSTMRLNRGRRTKKQKERIVA